jgi:purine-nucleoside phosphorylase
VVLGSGFQSVLSSIDILKEIPFRRLPGFPRLTVPGHAGKIVVGYLEKVPILLVAGRGHYYEGLSLDEVTFPIRVLAQFGVRALLLTSAAGGIRRRLRPGDFMVVSDHVNGMGIHPLRGPVPRGLARFVDLTDAYDVPMRKQLKQAGRKAGVRLAEGIYLAVSGPSYETPAEIRFFARMGVDAVGMSTVPEAIVARQHKLKVAALCCITNLAAGRAKGPLSHEEVLRISQQAGDGAKAILRHFVGLYGAEMELRAGERQI